MERRVLLRGFASSATRDKRVEKRWVEDSIGGVDTASTSPKRKLAKDEA